MKTKREVGSPTMTLIFNDQDQKVGFVAHHGRSEFTLHLNGWYWKNGEANLRGGSSGQAFPSLTNALTVAAGILQRPQSDESMHPANTMSLDAFIASLEEARQTLGGSAPVVFTSSAGGGFVRGVHALSPRVTEVKAHHQDYFLVDALSKGGYGGTGAFTEPYQSQILARPTIKAIQIW